MWLNRSIFAFLFLESVMFMEDSLTPRLDTFIHVFLCMVSYFILKPVIHLEFILENRMENESNFVFFQMTTQISQHYL